MGHFRLGEFHNLPTVIQLVNGKGRNRTLLYVTQKPILKKPRNKHKLHCTAF